MKRALNILFLTVFTTGAVGINITTTRCLMFPGKAMHTSSCCHKENKDCCEKQVTYLKIQNDYQTSLKIQPERSEVTVAALLFEDYFSIQPLQRSVNGIISDHSPPGKHSNFLALIQCFLI